MQKIDNENQIFQQAVSFVNHTRKSIFLTGKAGTGKTTFLRYIKENSPKKMAIIAPTGVAAINAGGTTIHSFFQLPFGTFLPTDESIWGGESQNVYNKTQLLRNQRLRQPQRKLIQSLELLIIDEVSMLRSDILDAMDTLMRSVRRQPYVPFGGVQMLFIGDMHQLPPVIRQSEMSLMNRHYSGPFFFNAQVMNELPLLYLELKKIYRQKDERFIRLLENVRNNCCGSDDFELLQNQYQPHFSGGSKDGFITLTTHNNKADAINQLELERIPGKTVEIPAKIEKNFPENAFPAEQILRLKTGAQIMFIKNDKGDSRRYYNGKIGTITKLDPLNKKIEVTCDNELDPILLELEVWKNIKYELDKEKDKIEETELGSFQQYPIRLAWAVTIHKSQGLTFEKAIIDAGQSFAPGQVYVALSRLTNLEGLVLHSHIHPRNIMVDPRILQFSQLELQESEISRVLEYSQLDFAKDLLLQAFDFELFIEEFRDHSSSYYEKQIPDRPLSFDWSQNLLIPIYEQHDTAKKFSSYLQSLFQQPEIDYRHIHERTQAATQWFLNSLETKVISSIKAQIEKQKNKPRTKKYIGELEDLLKTAEQKKSKIERSLLLTEALGKKTNIQDAFLQFQLKEPKENKTQISDHEIHSRIQKIVEERQLQKKEEKKEIKVSKKNPKGSSQELSYQYYKEGKSVEEIAEIRGFALTTIEGHLIHYVKVGLVDIDFFVGQDKLERIAFAIRQNPTATSSVIRSFLGEDYSFTEIKAAMAYEERKLNSSSN